MEEGKENMVTHLDPSQVWLAGREKFCSHWGVTKNRDGLRGMAKMAVRKN